MVNTFMVIVVAIFFAHTIGGCPTPAPKPPPVPDASDASVVDPGLVPDPDDPGEAADASSPACVHACSQLKKLGCPEAAKPDGGKTCYKVCADAEASGKFSLKPMCVAGAQSIEQLRTCGTVRCKK